MLRTLFIIFILLHFFFKSSFVWLSEQTFEEIWPNVSYGCSSPPNFPWNKISFVSRSCKNIRKGRFASNHSFAGSSNEVVTIVRALAAAAKVPFSQTSITALWITSLMYTFSGTRLRSDIHCVHKKKRKRIVNRAKYLFIVKNEFKTTVKITGNKL